MTFASPIEVAMAEALSRVGNSSFCPMRLMPTFRLEYEACRKKAYQLIANDNEGALIYPHVRLGPYEIDFLILYRDFNKVLRPIAVECDGHEFHEKTKQQAEHDKRRDRYFVLHGIFMYRFTGAEIWRDPGRCAEELLRVVVFGQQGPREWAWHGDPLSDKHQEGFERKFEQEREVEAEKEWQRLEFIENEILAGTYEDHEEEDCELGIASRRRHEDEIEDAKPIPREPGLFTMSQARTTTLEKAGDAYRRDLFLEDWPEDDRKALNVPAWKGRAIR